MNETIRSILDRRSIRHYKSEQFPQSDLDLIIQAGLYAPSARNTQPWHLTVIRSPGKIIQLTAEVKAATARMPNNRYRELVASQGYTVNFHAPTFIIVAIDPALSAVPEADCALVLGNMFLAAYSLGLGSCWVNQLNALNDEQGFREYVATLGVPLNCSIYGCGTFGYSEKKTSKAPERRMDTFNIIE